MKVRVPYGETDAFNIEVADNQLVGVYNPNPVTKPDADQVISEALAHPIDSPSFDEFINTLNCQIKCNTTLKNIS